MHQTTKIQSPIIPGQVEQLLFMSEELDRTATMLIDRLCYVSSNHPSPLVEEARPESTVPMAIQLANVYSRLKQIKELLEQQINMLEV